MYAAAFALHPDYADHADSSYASSRDALPFHGANGGNDATFSSVIDLGGRMVDDESEDAKDSDEDISLGADDSDGDPGGYEERRGEDTTLDISQEARSDFNLTPGDSATLSYEFDFPDYFSDAGSTGTEDDGADLRVDESLLDSICRHQLDNTADSLTAGNVAARDEYHDVANDCVVGASDVYIIPPPPDAVYESHEAAELAIHEWTLAHHFNVSRRRVRKLPGSEKKLGA
jgi:hypothetical protein